MYAECLLQYFVGAIFDLKKIETSSSILSLNFSYKINEGCDHQYHSWYPIYFPVDE